MARRGRRPTTAAASSPKCWSTATAISSSPTALPPARSWRRSGSPTGSTDFPRAGEDLLGYPMHQLPIFLTLAGRTVVLVGAGEAAAAKARLLARAGGRIVPEWETGAGRSEERRVGKECVR